MFRGHLTVAFLVGILVSACGGRPAHSPKRAPGPQARSSAAQRKVPSGNSITNLYDAFGPDAPGTKKDFGFSALIRHEGKTILFDAGTNADVLKKNVEALGIDLRDVDIAVASHSHFDHVSGFDYLLEVNPDVVIYFPDDPFWGAPMPFDATGTAPDAAEDLPEELRYFDGETTTFTFQSSGRFWRANVEFVSESREIAPGLTLVATRSPYMGYFSSYPNTGIAGEVDASELKQLGLPELSLALSTGKGDVVMVGCSHSRVDAIVEETKRVRGRSIHLVYGGYHLLPYAEEDVVAIATKLRDELKVTEVAPAHCTGHLGFKVLRDTFGAGFHQAGLSTTISIPD